MVASGWTLRRWLTGTDLHGLLARARTFGPRHVLLGLGCTVGSFLVLGAIELLALRQARSGTHRMPDTDEIAPSEAITTAFVANALSQSIGLALLTGAAVRLRAYTRRGLDAVTVARVTALVTLTATLGLLTASANALWTSSAPLHARDLSVATRPLAAVLAIPVVAYLLWAAVGRGAVIGRGRWKLTRPSRTLAVAQVGLSTLDWLFAGTVLFAFVPAMLGIGYWALLRAYMIAQMVGVTSHVPGGVGVLELVLLALLAGGASATDRTAILASILMFRVVYYLVPLIVAIVVAGVAELRRSVRARSLEGAYVG